MVTPKGKCEQWQCHATRDQVPQPNAALDGLPSRSVWERLKSAISGPWRTANTSAFLLTKRRNRHAHLTLPYVSCKGIP